MSKSQFSTALFFVICISSQSLGQNYNSGFQPEQQPKRTLQQKFEEGFSRLMHPNRQRNERSRVSGEIANDARAPQHVYRNDYGPSRSSQNQYSNQSQRYSTNEQASVNQSRRGGTQRPAQNTYSNYSSPRSMPSGQVDYSPTRSNGLEGHLTERNYGSNYSEQPAGVRQAMFYQDRNTNSQPADFYPPPPRQNAPTAAQQIPRNDISNHQYAPDPYAPNDVVPSQYGGSQITNLELEQNRLQQQIEMTSASLHSGSGTIPASQRVLQLQEQVVNIRSQYQSMLSENQRLRELIERNNITQSGTKLKIEEANQMLKRAIAVNTQLTKRIAELEQINLEQQRHTEQLLEKIKADLDEVLMDEMVNAKE